MRKWAIVIRIIVQFIIKPSSSYFVVVEKVCQAELKKKPNDFYSNWFLGELYVKYNKHEKALKILEPLHNADRGDKKLELLLARAYFNVKDYEKVISGLEEIELKEKESATYYLGVSLIERGSAEKGIDYLEKYLMHHPKDYIVHWKLGYEYFRIGEYEKAIDSYDKSRKLKPNKKIDEDIKICYERLGRMAAGDH